LDAADMDPTVINGGIINAWASNARLGEGEWMVVEADESDGTFVKLHPTIAVVTNIDAEHLDHYGSFDALRRAFVQFIENVPFYGFATLCIDDPEVQALIPKVFDRKIVTYGRNPQAQVRVENTEAAGGGVKFDVVVAGHGGAGAVTMKGLYLPMYGNHNVQNAVAAIAVATQMGLDEAVIRSALSEFRGVKRRFTKTGEASGITVIDDYGHHPVEISAVLEAARSAAGEGRIIAVMQPHRYSRLRNLFEAFCTCFNNADTVIVSDVYAAGEEPIDGFDRASLVDGLRQRGHRSVISLSAPDQLAAEIAAIAKPGDMVVCLGAGNITQWANALPQELGALLDREKEARG
ncbi:MAG: UDP-N-acetylmuramate--L-alanine ligase, partial [Rhodospirillales bacterium]|nr:UDP-N-acetylmuramate--L-alanine ligase [Rhodospirillales bacterium]